MRKENPFIGKFVRREGSLLLFLILSVTLGCQPAPRIDASSEDAMKASVAKVRAALPEEKRLKFDESVNILTFTQTDLKEPFTQGGSGRIPPSAGSKSVLHGRTAAEVIAEADRILAERREKERQQALGEIEELEEKRERFEKARKELERFEVLRSRFYKERVGFLGPQPFVELSVRNATEQTVSRAHFIGTLASPDRPLPWLRERFSHRIEGNLEPGREGTWKMPMNPFSAWGTTDLPDDVVLTVEVDELEAPGARTLYSRGAFSETDERRLARLKEEYAR